MIFITQLHTALNQGSPFSVVKDDKGQWQIEKLPIWKRIVHYKNHEYHQQRIDRIAQSIFESLQQVPALPMDKTLKHPALGTARKFLRQFDFSKEQTFYIKQCSRQLLASKLGITLQIFEKYPGFEEFAFKCHLERYLIDYGH